MLKKFISAAALGLALTACDDTCTEPSTMTDSTLGGNFIPDKQDGSDLQRVAGDRVFFALDSSNVDAKGKATLMRQAEWLKSNDGKMAMVEGHCDERGTTEYNLALGERRANTVMKHLVDMGVDSSRIKTVSYGKERPAVDGHNEAAWSENRRAVTVVD